MKRKTQIYSIFGQIEEAAAETLIAAGEAKKISVDMIPAAELYNERGQPARFAVVVPGEHIIRFEKLIADLYA